MCSMLYTWKKGDDNFIRHKIENVVYKGGLGIA